MTHKTTLVEDIVGGAAVLVLTLGLGCQSPQESITAPALPPSAPAVEGADALSYGMVTGRVKKNETTQQDLIDLFGGPTTMTTDRDGTEVWMYDRTSTTTEANFASSTADDRRTSAALMASYFGISQPIDSVAGGVGVRSRDAGVSQSRSSTSRSVRTITVVVKFNADKTVKDYTVRQSSY